MITRLKEQVQLSIYSTRALPVFYNYVLCDYEVWMNMYFFILSECSPLIVAPISFIVTVLARFKTICGLNKLLKIIRQLTVTLQICRDFFVLLEAREGEERRNVRHLFMLYIIC